MTKKDESIGLSATVLRVIEQFTSVMRTDETIDNDLINRLEEQLLSGTIPKPNEIKSILFSPQSEAET